MSHPDSTNLLDRIRAGRETHAQLRAVRPTPETLEEKLRLHASLRLLMDELWSRTGQIADARLRGSLRSAIRGLTVDADYYSGVQAEAEGYRDAADVAELYDLLESQFATSGDHP